MPVLSPAYPTSLYEIPITPRTEVSSREEREQLTEAALNGFFKMMAIWKVRDEDARNLLGGLSNGPYYTWKKHPERVLASTDVLTRISLLLGIFEALNAIYGPKLADEWVRLPNTNRIFRGQTPLQYMLAGGILAIQIVRRLLTSRQLGK